MKYYLDGNEITEDEAWMFMTNERIDIDPEELAAIWDSRGVSEEARDTIFELSDCCLEVITDD